MIPATPTKMTHIISEVARGNFAPAIYALCHKLIPEDYIDQTGFHILHHAVFQKKTQEVLILLDDLKINVDIKSQHDQTPLMLACMNGDMELIKIFVERGANVNLQDNTLFSPIFYCVKGGFVPQTAYLLQLKSDLSTKDASGCNLAHWAAYQNNPFLLQVLNSLQVSLRSEDNMGLTPLERAIESESFQAVEYLLKNIYDENDIFMQPRCLKLEEIKRPDLKELVRRRFNPSKIENAQNKAMKSFKPFCRVFVFVLYIILWGAAAEFYRHTIMHNSSLVDMVMIFVSIYFFGLSYLYILKADGSKKSLALECEAGAIQAEICNVTNDEQSHLGEDVALNITLESKRNQKDIVSTGNDEKNMKSTSFLDEMNHLFQVKNFAELKNFDKRDFCADCLTRRSPKSAHPDNSTCCVQNFHHYSHLLGKNVDSSNHIFYFSLLLAQAFGLGLLVVGCWFYYWNQIINTKIWAFEVGFLIHEQAGATYHLLYWVLTLLMLYNFILLGLEVYGIVYNLTYHEIFNAISCTYLHKVGTDRVKSFHNPFDQGMKRNILSYFKRNMKRTA